MTIRSHDLIEPVQPARPMRAFDRPLSAGEYVGAVRLLAKSGRFR